jgi:hypothetical protein
MKTCKFRPSSHSDDSTIVAVFKTNQQAQDIADRLEQQATVNGKKLTVVTSNAEYGTSKNVETTLRRFKPQALEVYEYYQELKVMVKVVAGASPDALPLIMPTAVTTILVELLKRCPVEIAHKGKFDQWTFHYRGEGIFFGFYGNTAQEAFEFDETSIPLPKGIHVQVLKNQ